MSSKQNPSQVSAGANRVGYGSDGIKSGTAAADQMSSEAKRHGGKIPSWSTVSEMQSAGSKGRNHSGKGADY